MPSLEPFSFSILLINKMSSFLWFSSLHLLSGLTQKKEFSAFRVFNFPLENECDDAANGAGAGVVVMAVRAGEG